MSRIGLYFNDSTTLSNERVSYFYSHFYSLYHLQAKVKQMEPPQVGSKNRRDETFPEPVNQLAKSRNEYAKNCKNIKDRKYH